MRLAACESCEQQQQLVQLPASFNTASQATIRAQLEPVSTPLSRPDPTQAWRDLATVASVVNIATDVLLWR